MQRGVALVWLGLTLATGCTTSRPVIAWHDAWRAEAEGDRDGALELYGLAARDPALTGAACNRVRLLAATPGREAEAKELLQVLVKRAASSPDVAMTAAWFALQQGDAKLARQQWAGARTLRAADPPVWREMLAATAAAVLAAEGRWQEAQATLAGLPQAATETGLAVAVAAWNGLAPVETVAVPAAADAAAAWRLRAWLALQQGQWPGVCAALAHVADADRSADDRAVLAWAWLQQGEIGQALALLATNSRASPQHALTSEVLAVAQIRTGDAVAARDQLAALVARGGGGWSAWWNLGLAHLQLRDPQAALAAFDQGLLRCPHCQSLRQNRDVLRRQLGAPSGMGGLP